MFSVSHFMCRLVESDGYIPSLGKDLTEAEEIKKRWQEYTEELYKERS